MFHFIAIHAAIITLVAVSISGCYFAFRCWTLPVKVAFAGIYAMLIATWYLALHYAAAYHSTPARLHHGLYVIAIVLWIVGIAPCIFRRQCA